MWLMFQTRGTIYIDFFVKVSMEESNLHITKTRLQFHDELDE
jgi:hypothetical protein